MLAKQPGGGRVLNTRRGLEIAPWRRHWPVVAAALLLLALLPGLGAGLAANVQRLGVLRHMDLAAGAPSSDEQAWDAGWRSLCGTAGAAAGPAAGLQTRVDDALWFTALARLDAGDYAGALPLFERLAGLPGQARAGDAAAYAAALGLDWQEALRLAPAPDTARHQRWWGTVAYLAAQELVFAGRQAEAGALYRRADAAYDVQGPYLGLALVGCLEAAGRPLEAMDAYRRALAVLPADEALAHQPRFDHLRLAGLRAWLAEVPGDAQAARWLAFYEDEADVGGARDEALAAAPQPGVPLDLDLGGGRRLVGLDYRREDLETGPFMRVDFYVREGEGEAVRYQRLRRTVLNQAPNGAFAWDRVPDGVRPAGWHGLMYDRNLDALSRENLPADDGWLCLDAVRIGAGFGLQADNAGLPATPSVYLQGGDAYLVRGGGMGMSRTWFGVTDPHNYSGAGGVHDVDQVKALTSLWVPPAGSKAVAVWLMVDLGSKGCFREIYLFALPEL